MRFTSIEKIGNDEMVALPKQKATMLCFRFYPEVRCDGSCKGETCDGFACEDGRCITMTAALEFCGGSSGDSSSPIIYTTTEENPVGGGSTTDFSFSPNTFSNLDLNDPNFINEWHTINVWLNLDGDKVLFFRSSQENMNFFIQTIQYQIDNNWSQESATIANMARNLKHDNPEVTWEDTKNKLIAKAIEDQIDDSKLDPCSKGVLDKLKKLNQNDIASIFEKFDIPENGTYNIQMVTGTPNNPTAIADTRRLSKNNYLITIRESYIKGTDNNQNPPTDIAVAAILIHELIHAHFFALFDDFYNNGNNCAYDNYDCLYEKYVTKTYIGTIDEQHAQMFDNYVPKIASILQEFKPGLSLQFYEDIAMSTMYGLQYFNHKYPKNSPDRNRIENNRNAEDSNAPRGSATPNGSPCN